MDHGLVRLLIDSVWRKYHTGCCCCCCCWCCVEYKKMFGERRFSLSRVAMAKLYTNGCDFYYCIGLSARYRPFCLAVVHRCWRRRCAYTGLVTAEMTPESEFRSTDFITGRRVASAGSGGGRGGGCMPSCVSVSLSSIGGCQESR